MTRSLALLFAVALVLRLVVLFTGPWSQPTRIYPHAPDSPRYVALASEEVKVKDKRMQLFRACEPRTCESSWIRVLYSEDGKRALLYVSDAKLGIKIFGDPTPEELAFLTR